MSALERKVAIGAGVAAAAILALALGVWAERGPAMLTSLWIAICG